MISEINVYFRISKIIVFDIQNNFFRISQIKFLFGIISGIRNNYSGYRKKNSDIQKIILDIRITAYQRQLFWIFEIISAAVNYISDIRNSCMKLYLIYFYLWFLVTAKIINCSMQCVHLFQISKIVITDIRNNYFEYP